MNLSSRLNSKVVLYGKTKFTNELNETDYHYTQIAKMWAEITPNGGGTNNGTGNMVVADISHKFVIRTTATLTNDMYFMFKEQRYEIKYFNPNYKYRDSIEIFCSLVVE